MNLTEILSHAKTNTSGRGIFTASRYLSDVAGCLSGGTCPTKIMDLSSPEDWEENLKRSTSVLTATDPDWTFDEKSFTTEKGYILVATGIMSTSKMDSDRDILEAKGAEIESVCPYLWHHIMVQPVGKVLSHTLSTVKSGEKDLDAVLFKCGIADVGNGLGRDTALLIEMGALRNSHGFEPLDASPIKGAGWHVTKYRTFEISAVTVPANSDAVFTEYSKEKSRFQSDMVKSWIKGHYDERVKSWKGWTSETSAAEEVSAEQETPCSCKTKTPDLAKALKTEKFYLPGLPGSWEFTQSALRKSCREYIRGEAPNGCGCHYGYIESTYDDYVVLCVYEDDGETYYKVSWGLVEGVPALTGEATKVDFSFNVTMTEAEEEEDEKAHSSVETKSFHHQTLPVGENMKPEQVRVVDPVLASLGL